MDGKDTIFAILEDKSTINRMGKVVPSSPPKNVNITIQGCYKKNQSHVVESKKSVLLQPQKKAG
jgi:hypothetical protein